MSKFKVGDVVKIRTGLPHNSAVGGLFCYPHMAECGGELDVIERMTMDGTCTLKNHRDTFWSVAMLEPVEIPKLPLEKLTIVSNGTMTWAIHRLPDGNVKKSRVLREQGMERDFGRDAKRAAQEAGVGSKTKGADEYRVDIDMEQLYDALRACITVKPRGGKDHG